MLGMREGTVVVALKAIDRQAVAGRSCLSIVATMLAGGCVCRMRIV